MPKVILFSILWGLFWESFIFDFKGFYLFPVFVAAVFISYSPLIIRAANIVIGWIILLVSMFLLVFTTSGFRMPSSDFIFHILFYTASSLMFISAIYVLEKK